MNTAQRNIACSSTNSNNSYLLSNNARASQKPAQTTQNKKH